MVRFLALTSVDPGFSTGYQLAWDQLKPINYSEKITAFVSFNNIGIQPESVTKLK